MPRETITGSAVAGSGGFHVKVGWARDQEVQIGVEADEGHSLFWVLLGVADYQQGATDRTRRLAEIGDRLREAMATPPPVDPDGLRGDAYLAQTVLNTIDTAAITEYRGVWSDMDRAGCNRLIQTVRKARDAAFGRDE